MRLANIVLALLLALAGMLWLGLIAIAPDMQSSDALGRGITCALVNVGLISLWVILAGAVLLVGVSARAEVTSGIFVGLLLLGSVAAALASVRVFAGTAAPGWMLVVVLAPPPIVASLAVAMHSPRLRHAAPPVLLNALWCVLIALTLLPCPFVVREARLESEQSSRSAVRPSTASPSRPTIVREAAHSTVLLAVERSPQRH